ncbi:MAG: hypothetical protein Unbinned1693contig1002_3 [Prokaryotic dsDNA virus sp.]|jgi:hypothetical protein|nr:MAG: hypothetical protein Unbinned1693contig1002_3 [Prokaryotic dsDNA virus sp.]|tara:strand:+ start:13529 stop:13750 length:222 start_codon:yes stop_codon:yes gene_type:complete
MIKIFKKKEDESFSEFCHICNRLLLVSTTKKELDNSIKDITKLNEKARQRTEIINLVGTRQICWNCLRYFEVK